MLATCSRGRTFVTPPRTKRKMSFGSELKARCFLSFLTSEIEICSNRFIQSFPTIKAYIKYARFEERQRQTGKAREVFERLSDELPEELVTADYYLAFAKFEERAREPERARAIYK